VLADHVKFGGEGIEVANYALEFLGQGAVLFVESFMVVGVVGVGVAECFDLNVVRDVARLFAVMVRSEGIHIAQTSCKACDTDIRISR
jgi:uncharacterized membrane protein